MNADAATLSPAGSRLSAAFVPACAFLVLLAMSWTQIPPVWTTGAFGDTDDALRMTQVRDLLAGQSWFDLAQRRMAAPEGAPMHWTRVVDAPLAALISLAGLAFEPARAEALARLLYSSALLALLLAGAARLARVLMGEEGVAPVLASVALSGAVFGQFIWGRIDHHALQLVLLVFVLEAGLRALDPRHPRAGARAGALSALSLCVSVENAPLVAGACALLPLRWIVDGQGRAALAWLAAGLAGALSAGALVFIPAGALASRACDSFSPAYALAGACACVALAALWALAPRLASWRARAASAVGLGAFAAGCVAFAHPQCLRHPYGAIDPLVRDIWLANVPEARSFLALWREDAADGFVFAAPLLLASCALVWAILSTRGLMRLRWIALGGMGLVAWALILVEVRSFWQALFVLSWSVAYAGLWAQRQGGARWLAFAPLVIASPIFWAMAKAIAQDAPAARASAACYEPSSYASLAALAPGRVLAPINLGSHVLAHTHHDVLGGAYHRLSAANRRLLEMFLAAPEEARGLMRAAGVRYVATCFDAQTLASFTRRAPQGLAATLARGDARIDWLFEHSIKDAPMRVYEAR